MNAFKNIGKMKKKWLDCDLMNLIRVSEMREKERQRQRKGYNKFCNSAKIF